jgi:hypothetical protein
MKEPVSIEPADSFLLDIDVLKNTVVDETQSTITCQSPDVERHFARLQRGFFRKPSLSFELVKIIVLIRRGISLEHNVKLFFRITELEIDFLLSALSTRWLLSIADTYADYGTPVQQATAAMIVLLFNTMKLTETERLIVVDNRHDQTQIELNDQCRARHEPLELWDAMTAYSVPFGDMPRNMIGRMRGIAARDKVLAKVLDTLLERALSGQTILSRFAVYNPRFMPAEWSR